MANEITANLKFPWGGVGPKTFLQAAVHTYTTASNSGIVLGSAVCVVNGNAVLARANASGTLATGLVSKVISTTRCEVMTAGIYTGYEKASLAVRDVLYLSPTTAGLLTAEKPSAADEIVQVVALVTAIAENETTCELEMRVGGLSNADGAALSRIADVVTGTVDGTVGVGPVTDPQATLHVLGDCAVATAYNTSSAALLTLSRREASLSNGETLGKISFCGLESNAAPFALGSEAASLYATVSGTWIDASHVAASVYLSAVKGTVNLSTDYGVGFTLGADGTSTMPHVAVVGNIGSLTDPNVLSVLGGASIFGPSSFGSTLGVTGATTLSSTLGVTGATTLSSTLGVTGDTTLTGTFEISSAVDNTPPLARFRYVAATILDNEELGKIVFLANETGQDASYAGVIGAHASGAWGADGQSELRFSVSNGSNGTTQPMVLHKLGADIESVLTVSTSSNDDGLVRIWGDGLALDVAGFASITGGVNPFTGLHVYPVAAVPPIGGAVVLSGNQVTLSSTPRAKNCVGIVADTVTQELDSLQTGVPGLKARVAAVGDNFSGDLRGFLVCNENGPIAAGDLLCTSSVPGHLMKQDDDIIRAYTVGKAMQDVVFDESGKASGVYGYIYCG